MQLVQGGQALAAGLALGMTYVLSIGPNNMMIIREGLVRGRVILVASVVLASYVLLLALSYGATDAIASWSASLTTVLSCLGIGAMIWFAGLSIRAALGAHTREIRAPRSSEPLTVCLRRVALVVAVNPLLYIEFLLIPSGALGTLKEPLPRLEFTLGLIVMAALACYGYAAGGRACATLIRHRKAMQIFDLASGCVLGMLALTMSVALIQSART